MPSAKNYIESLKLVSDKSPETPEISQTRDISETPNTSQASATSPTSKMETKDPEAALKDPGTPGTTFYDENSSEEELSNQPPGTPAKDITMLGCLEPLAPWRRGLIMSGLCTGLLLSIMDTSIISTSIYAIAIEFDSLAKALWVVLAYSLVYLGLATTFATMSDYVGRFQMVMFAFVMFVAFSIGAGFAQNVDQLIALRALQGMGGSGLYSLAVILLVEVSNEKFIGITTAAIGGTIAMAGVLGPIVGGLLTDYVSWRWIFWINGPIGVAAALAFMIGWPHGTAAYEKSKKSFKRFDYIGTTLLLASTVLVVFGLQEAGSGFYPWNSAVVITTLVMGCVSWVASVIWSFFTSKTPIHSAIPSTLLRKRIWVAGLFVTALSGFVYFVCIISLPLRFQIVNRKSPIGAGISLLPLLASTGVGSFTGGMFAKKKGNASYVLIVAACLILLGSGLMSTLGHELKIPNKAYGFEVIVGFGIGLTFSSMSVLTSMESDHSTHAVAQGLIGMARIFGGSCGVAASNALFNVYSHRRLGGILTNEEIDSLQTSTRILTTLMPSQLEVVRQAYADGFSDCLRICAYLTAASVVISLFTSSGIPKKQPHKT